MSYIIAATDFSTISDNAVNYAANLAVLHCADLVIVHSFAFPVMVTDGPIPGSLIDDTQRDAEKRIKELEKKVAENHPDINIKCAVTYGSLIETVEAYAKGNGKPWLTVLGNSNTTENTAWFFSTLKEAAKHLNYTILAIPPTAHYKPIRKICFGLDIDHPENKGALQILRDITVQMGSSLHVINAQEEPFDPDDVPQIPDSVKEILADTNPVYYFRYDAKTDESIREFCTSIAADWLAIQPGKYPFIESLFHQSHTKALAGSMDIPILILH